MAMKLVKRTDEYSIYQRSDDRYAVKDANKKPINGDEKVRILVAEELIKAALPAEPEPDEAVEEEVVAEEASAEEAEAPAEEEPAEEEPAAEELRKSPLRRKPRLNSLQRKRPPRNPLTKKTNKFFPAIAESRPRAGFLWPWMACMPREAWMPGGVIR